MFEGNLMTRISKTCGAKTKTNDHQPCRREAMPNGRCHLHGGIRVFLTKTAKCQLGLFSVKVHNR